MTRTRTRHRRVPTGEFKLLASVPSTHVQFWEQFTGQAAHQFDTARPTWHMHIHPSLQSSLALALWHWHWLHAGTYKQLEPQREAW